jgi:hypothetical protein
MADPVSIAMKREAAMRRLMTASKLLSERFGIAPLVLPKQGHDPQLKHANQLVAIADYMEALATAPEKEKASNGKTVHSRTHRKKINRPKLANA